MLLRQWIAPMPNAFHREKERRRRTRQFCQAVPSTAAYFELLMSLAGETPRENAASCDPDKRMMQRQENTVRSASAALLAGQKRLLEFRAVTCKRRAATW